MCRGKVNRREWKCHGHGHYEVLDELHSIEMGHWETVFAIAVFPDNHRVVVGCRNGLIMLDVESHLEQSIGHGAARYHMPGHSGWVQAVAVSSDGSKIVSGGEDGTVRIWDGDTRKELHSMKAEDGGHCYVGGDVFAVCMFADGRVVYGGEKGTVNIWNVESGEVVVGVGHNDFVNAVAVFTDNSKVVSGSSDNTVMIWNSESGEKLHTLNGHHCDVNSVAVSVDFIVSGGEDGIVFVWNANTGEKLYTIPAQEQEGLLANTISNIVIFPDRNAVPHVVYVSGRKAHIWNVESAMNVCTMIGESDYMFSVDVFPDGNVVSGGEDGKVKIWEI